MTRIAAALLATLALVFQASVAIPFELATRHVIVKLTINGSRPLSFVLDTGANAAIVQTHVAKELGLTTEGTIQVGGAGASTATGSRVRNATWSLVGLEHVKQPVSLALPLTQLSSGMGRDIDGIIGGEFIKQFVVELDYQSRTLMLHDPSTFNYTGRGESLPLEFTGETHPLVRATVAPDEGTPIEGKFVIDIGSGLALALYSPFVRQHGLPRAGTKTIRAIGMAGAGGASIGRLGRVAWLQIGSFKIREPYTVFSEDTAGAFANPSQAGNIGAQILSRFRVFFDYRRRRIILEPTATLDRPFDRAQTGLAVRAEGTDYRTFRVKDVLEDSPATEAGIVPGDVITAVNGTPATALTLTALGELMEKPGAYELKIRRGDETLTLTLNARRLF